MTRAEIHERRKSLQDDLLCAWAVAIIFNAVGEIFGSPAWLDVIRALVSLLFVALLVGWVWWLVWEWRATRAIGPLPPPLRSRGELIGAGLVQAALFVAFMLALDYATGDEPTTRRIVVLSVFSVIAWPALRLWDARRES